MSFHRLVYSRFLHSVLAATLCVALPTSASRAAKDEEKVVAAVRSMYVAATNDDLDLFRAVTSPDFYAFDVGKRMSGDELMAFVINAHAAGKVYVWQVTEPQVHVDGETAWITYVNRGSLEDETGRKELSWLESVVLRRSNGVWRVHFLHSTRVPSE